jgi:hypothetical protein
VTDPETLRAALDALVRQAPVSAIDELWIFPTRRSEKSQSTVIVASAFAEGEDDRRRILTAHLTTRQEMGRRVVQEIVAEQGVAPADRVGRLVDGVMRRLDEELAALPPRAVRIGGELAAWEEMLATIAASDDGAAAAEATHEMKPEPEPGPESGLTPEPVTELEPAAIPSAGI